MRPNFAPASTAEACCRLSGEPPVDLGQVAPAVVVEPVGRAAPVSVTPPGLVRGEELSAEAGVRVDHVLGFIEDGAPLRVLANHEEPGASGIGHNDLR